MQCMVVCIWWSARATMYLDVPVGDAQAVAEVDGYDQLLEQAARALLRQRATLQHHWEYVVRKLPFSQLLL